MNAKTALTAVAASGVLGLGGGVLGSMASADSQDPEAGVTAGLDELASTRGSYVRFHHYGDDLSICDTQADGHGVYVKYSTTSGQSGRYGHSGDDTCHKVTSTDFPETAVVTVEACVDINNDADRCSNAESRRANGGAP